MSILALFPGQGSQKIGMGKELFESSTAAKERFAEADETLGFALSTICFEGPIEKLTLTEITQPAILTVSVICFEMAQAKLGSQLKVVAGAGHSLGEYSAYVAAGALKFSDAVRLVNKRGMFMQQAVPIGTGKMVAVLGQELSAIEEAISRVTGGCVSVANINAPGQVVVAGSKESVDQFMTEMKGAKITELNVSAPFHCALMKPAEMQLREELKQIEIKTPSFPIYTNYSAKPVVEPDAIRESLALQVCGRVRWVECMENAISATSPEAAWEFGNGAVLSGLLKRIKAELPRKNVQNPSDLEQ